MFFYQFIQSLDVIRWQAIFENIVIYCLVIFIIITIFVAVYVDCKSWNRELVA